MSTFMYVNEKMLGRKKERCRIKGLQMDKHRDLLAIRRKGLSSNPYVRELWNVFSSNVTILKE